MRKTTLSPVIAGTMNWGDWDKKLTTSEMVHLMNICIENKISVSQNVMTLNYYKNSANFF